MGQRWVVGAQSPRSRIPRGCPPWLFSVGKILKLICPGFCQLKLGYLPGGRWHLCFWPVLQRRFVAMMGGTAARKRHRRVSYILREEQGRFGPFSRA